MIKRRVIFGIVALLVPLKTASAADILPDPFRASICIWRLLRIRRWPPKRRQAAWQGAGHFVDSPKTADHNLSSAFGNSWDLV